MTERELNEKLERAARHAAPDNLQEVLSRCEPRKGTVINMKKTIKNQTRRWLAVAACFALLMVGGGGGILYQQSHAVASVVSLDVNPSIELKVNQKQKVLSCAALNEDAQEVLAEMDGGAALKGTDLDVAVNALVGALVRHGYLEEVSSAILISVEDKDTGRATRLEQELTTAVGDALSQKSAAASVLGQTLAKNDDLANKAQAHNISMGKAALVESVRAMNSKLDFDQLAALSVEELRDLADTGAHAMPIGKDAALLAALNYAGVTKDYTIDVDVDPELDDTPAHYEVELYHGTLGKVEYKVDAYSGQIISGPEDAMKGVPANPGQISQAQAIEIALKQAGFKQSDVSFSYAHKDMEDNTLIWEVEFYVNGVEYEYDVNAVTGAVMDFDQDLDDRDDLDDLDEDDLDVSAAASMSQAQAVEAALKHAGYTKSQVTGLKAEYDQEDREWDVDFKVNGMEFDYCIADANGSVTKWEKEAVETDDYDEIVSVPSDTAKISESSAKTKALNHAGLKQSQVTGMKAEYDLEDRTWELEFSANGMEYEYEISADGSIMKAEKEPA